MSRLPLSRHSLSRRPLSRHPLVGLAWRLALCTTLALAAVAVLPIAGVRLALPVPIAVGLLAGGLWWTAVAAADRADATDPPALDREPDYALPHAQDMRVRRLEDMIHGAQPRRRMTTRALGRTLAEIAEERARDGRAPELSASLRAVIEQSRRGDADRDSVPPIDRRTLHTYLRELADDGEERPG